MNLIELCWEDLAKRHLSDRLSIWRRALNYDAMFHKLLPSVCALREVLGLAVKPLLELVDEKSEKGFDISVR